MIESFVSGLAWIGVLGIVGVGALYIYYQVKNNQDD
jgi:hypothetical protein